MPRKIVLKGPGIGGTVFAMKRKTLVLTALALFLASFAAPALADELLRFKSGYEMMVVSHHEEGDMIIVTLDGGGTVGFPKESLSLLESGKPSTRTGPSPLYNKVPSRVNMRQFKAPLDELPSRFLARGASNSSGVTVGYSKHGKGMQRFNGGPLEGANASGKIGIDVRDAGKMRMYTGPGRDPSSGPEPVVKPRTLSAIIPTSKEGD
jgi:hypothetical protein